MYMGFPGDVNGKEPTCLYRRHKSCRFDPCVGKITQRSKRQHIPAFLPEKSHGQKSLAGRLWTTGSYRVGHDRSNLALASALIWMYSKDVLPHLALLSSPYSYPV